MYTDRLISKEVIVMNKIEAAAYVINADSLLYNHEDDTDLDGIVDSADSWYLHKLNDSEFDAWHIERVNNKGWNTYSIDRILKGDLFYIDAEDFLPNSGGFNDGWRTIRTYRLTYIERGGLR